MISAPKTASKRRQRFIGIGLLILLLFNFFAFTKPIFHKPSVVMEWRKGPLIYESSPYSTTNAAKFFWPVAAAMLDIYLLAIGLWITRVRPRMPKMKTDWIEPLFAVAPLLAVMVAGEAMVRIGIHQRMFLQYRPDPELYWYNRPGLRNHSDVTDPIPKSTNSMGFRGETEIPQEKQPDEIRIFVVGDSSTFGLGVADQDTYSHVLETQLAQATGKTVRVINSGCPGHTSYQGLILLERYGLPLKPDLVIWAYNNDPCLDMAREKDRLAQNKRVIAIQRVLYRSDFYLVAMRVVLDRIYGWNLRQFKTKYPRNKDGWVRRIPFEDYKQYLSRFEALSREAGSKILYVRMPLNVPMCEEEPIFYTSFDYEYRDYLAEYCRNNNLPFVNFEKSFLDAYNKKLFLPGHLFHPSPVGHKIIGTQLATYALAMDLLD